MLLLPVKDVQSVSFSFLSNVTTNPDCKLVISPSEPAAKIKTVKA